MILYKQSITYFSYISYTHEPSHFSLFLLYKQAASLVTLKQSRTQTQNYFVLLSLQRPTQLTTCVSTYYTAAKYLSLFFGFFFFDRMPLNPPPPQI